MARRRTVTIASGEGLVGEQHADCGNRAWGSPKTGHPDDGFISDATA